MRVRGTDGKRTAPGFLGAAVDPAAPRNDLWFYAKPIFVLPS